MLVIWVEDVGLEENTFVGRGDYGFDLQVHWVVEV
jgi:hypothetical protein